MAYPLDGMRGFTLLEVMLVMLILTILVSGLAVPLSTQVAMRRHQETPRILDEAREAVLGFAATHGRLPCPATASSRGQESFAPGSDAMDGNCSNFHDGFLPAASLGLAPLDAEGFAHDGWETQANRVRYAVHGVGQMIGGVRNPLTRSNGMREATLDALVHFARFGATGAKKFIPKKPVTKEIGMKSVVMMARICHDLVHPIVDNGQIGIHGTAEQVAHGFGQIVQADQVVVNVAKEDPVPGVHHLKVVSGKTVEHLPLRGDDAPDGDQGAFKGEHALQHFWFCIGKDLVFDPVDLAIQFLDQRPVIGDKIVDDFIKQVIRAVAGVAPVGKDTLPGFFEGSDRCIMMGNDIVAAQKDVQLMNFDILPILAVAEDGIQYDVKVVSPVVHLGV